MRSGSRSSALLVELLIVIMFFMIACTILIRVFAEARRQSANAERLTVSLAEAQNVADRLYAAEDPGALLDSLGFIQQDGLWILEAADYRMEADISEEPEANGIWRRQEIRVTAEDGVLFTLPCSTWKGGTE